MRHRSAPARKEESMIKPRRTLAACASAGVLVLALAAPLLAAADARPRDQKRVDAPRAPEAGRARWLKVRVYENGATTPTVLVNLPLRAVTVAARLFAAAGALGGSVTIDAGGEP